MKSKSIKQVIEIKTENLDKKSLLGLRELINKYNFYFESSPEENSLGQLFHNISLTTRFRSIDQMFEFNQQLENILKE